MDYPDQISLEILEQTADNYEENCHQWEIIDDLIIGGSRLESKKKDYLKIMPLEDSSAYEHRVSNFTFDPVMASCINELSHKFATGTISVLDLPEGEGNVFNIFWENFRKNTSAPNNRKKVSEKELSLEIFYHLITYGICYGYVKTDFAGSLSEAIFNGKTPYVQLLHPSKITDKGEDELGEWFKIRNLKKSVSPLSNKNIKRIEWLFLDAEKYAIYSGNFEVTSNGSLINIVKDDGSLEPVSPYTKVALETMTTHGLSENPLLCYEIDEKQWITNRAYLRQLEHLRELNAKHSNNALMYIQRTFEPRVEQEDEMEALSETVEVFDSSNRHVLDVKEFKFNEAVGSSSTILLESTEDIATKIRKMYGLVGVETSPSKKSLERSGESKKADFIQTKIVLEYFGEKVIEVFQNIYEKISIAIRYPSEINVVGLSNFEINTLDQDLDTASKVEEMITSISPLALQIFYTRLSMEIAPTATPAQKQQIEREVSNIFRAAIMLTEKKEEDPDNIDKEQENKSLLDDNKNGRLNNR